MLLHPHNPTWADHFRQISEVLATAAGDYILAIHHIGSTAIPGLAAKPIIDIDVEVAAGAPLYPIIAALDELGYYHNGDQGIPGREVFKRLPAGTHPVLDAINHHLYVCAADNPELRRHLLFRDRLRLDEEARASYERIKLETAELTGQEHKAYAELKQERARAFVASVLNIQP